MLPIGSIPLQILYQVFVADKLWTLDVVALERLLKTWLSKSKLLFIIPWNIPKRISVLVIYPNSIGSYKCRLTLLAKIGKWETKTCVKCFPGIFIDKQYILQYILGGRTVVRPT